MKSAEKNEKKKIIWLSLFLSALLVVLSMFWFGRSSIPYIYNDEYGYWVSAAKYAGYDWSGVFNRISYYSYGYGLILSLLYRVTSDVYLIYRLALLLNVVWLLGSFCLLFQTGKLLYPQERADRLLLVSFLATCLPGNITQANYTWPEDFLFFLFCLLAYLILSLQKRPTVFKSAAIGVICVYSYAVHQRTIALVIASGMTLLLLLFIRKIKVRHLLAFAAAVLVAFLVHTVLKNDITGSIWAGGEAVAINNFEGQAGKISSLFTLAGIRNLVLSFSGKLFYLVIVGIWLIYFVVERFLVRLKESIVCLVKKRPEDVDAFGFFLLLVFLGTLAVGAIFMIIPSGTVHIVYGRYNEHILGPFILMALVELRACRPNYKRLFGYLICTVFLALSVFYSVNLFEPAGTAEVNSVGLASYVGNKTIDMWVIVLISMIGFFILCKLLAGGRKWEGLAYLLCLLVWIGLGYNAYYLFENNGIGAAVESTMECAQVIPKLEEELGYTAAIYVMSGGSSYPAMFSGNGIQYCLPDRTISYLSEKEIEAGEYEQDCIIMAPSVVEKPDGFNIAFKSSEYYLMVSQDSALAEYRLDDAEYMEEG